MKLMFMLATVLTLQVQARVAAQTISMTGKQLSFKEIFARLEKQTGYVVFYNLSLLDKTTPVNVDARNMPWNPSFPRS